MFDLVISTQLIQLIDSTEIGPQITDHNIIHIHLNISKTQPKQTQIAFRPIKKINLVLYRNDLIEHNILDLTSIYHSKHIFYKHLLEILNKHAPTKTIKKDNKKNTHITLVELLYK